MQEYSSAGTSINSSKLPKVFTWNPEKIWPQNDPDAKTKVNLDYGGGKFNNATDFLYSRGWFNLVYDPYNRTEDHNRTVRFLLARARAHTATLSNVLNVIKEPETRKEVLEDMYDMMAAESIALISVYEGDRSGCGKQTKKDCWQNNMKTEDYIAEVAAVFGEEKILIKNKIIFAFKTKVWYNKDEQEKGGK